MATSATTVKAKTTEQRTAERRAKLHELAPGRVEKALKSLSLCENLGNYKPTEEEAGKIIGALSAGVMRVKARLAGAKAETAFKL